MAMSALLIKDINARINFSEENSNRRLLLTTIFNHDEDPDLADFTKLCLKYRFWEMRINH